MNEGRVGTIEPNIIIFIIFIIIVYIQPHNLLRLNRCIIVNNKININILYFHKQYLFIIIYIYFS
jgi:hypothetical protein